MSKAPESMKHPETGVTLYRAVRPIAVFYGETSETADLPGWFPEDPALVDMGVLTPADCKFYDRIFNKLKAQAEGFLTPAEVRRIRRRLKLGGRPVTQVMAGEIICADTKAFRRYEVGDDVVPREVDCALRLLDERPTALAILPSAQRYLQAVDQGTSHPQLGEIAEIE